MTSQHVTTKQLYGLKVVNDKHKRLGKVRRFVFHPTERRCIGLLVKRPDAALMFHRKDLFVALDGFHIEEGEVVVHSEAEASDRAAIKALGVNWSKCVIWVGMPVMTKAGTLLGYVDVVTFDAQTGQVVSVTTENGAANDALLGKRVIPANLVRGFKHGVGMPLNNSDAHDAQDETLGMGAILVDDEAADVKVEGGVAAAAGKATAVVADKAKKGGAKAREAAAEQAQRAKPTVKKATKKTEKAVNAGAYAAGKQLGRASGMFAAFKEEYDKAVRGEDE